MVLLFISHRYTFEAVLPDVNLDDYVDLMPVDIREKYFNSRDKDNITEQLLVYSEAGFMNELQIAFQILEQRVCEIKPRDEVEISNSISGMVVRVMRVRFGIETTREMTIGRANKKLGETDLYFYSSCKENRKDITIIENKYIED